MSARTPRTDLPRAPARRVLVVDDNEDSAKMLGHLLRAFGHEVRVATSGEECLEIAAEFRPEFVFLDLGLPIVDGFEVARRLRRTPSGAEVVLVAVTGYGGDEDRERTQQAGFDHHIVKPADIEVLQGILAAPAAT